ncbi:hypothetical protein HNP32_001744 [Brevundimonas bullata]|uniref:Uncharacterized protein n=1 Tax=Brevundimonas bullata TaxID=13160 RepID=A0A7W7N341_9CAUL|nr:hypothetical protein [Brevundimonas bullata]MBB4798020.1 hypothetical protein [Brevundimonas bullata]MBB6382979.1 hypothetical protein [Brevundimonas bullata]
MAALVLPTRPAPSSMTPRPISSRNEQRPASQGPVNRYMRPGTRWAWDITLAPQSYVASLEWDDLLSESDTVIMKIYQPGLDTGAPGSPLIDGANQIGRTLNLKGLTPGYVFRKGQWISFPVLGQLFAYKVRTLTTVAGDGQVALPLLTLLRLPPANNAVVDVAQPRAEGFATVDPQSLEVGTDRLVRLRFTLEERE